MRFLELRTWNAERCKEGVLKSCCLLSGQFQTLPRHLLYFFSRDCHLSGALDLMFSEDSAKSCLVFRARALLLSGTLPQRRLASVSSELSGTLPGAMVSGTVPSAFVDCAFMVLDTSSLSGTLPQALFTVNRSVVIDHSAFLKIEDNPGISGSLPPFDQFNTSNALDTLGVRNMSISGTLPGRSRSTSVHFVQFDYLSISGSIPPYSQFIDLEIALLARMPLLSGTVSHTAAFSSTLQILQLTSTRLSGSLTSCLQSLTSLAVLIIESSPVNLDLNQMGIANMRQMTYVIITETNLDGTIPNRLPQNSDPCRAAQQCYNLSSLLLSGNRLSGSLPEELFQSAHPSLRFIDVTSNRRISGKRALRSLASLTQLFAGTLPQSLAKWPALHTCLEVGDADDQFCSLTAFLARCSQLAHAVASVITQTVQQSEAFWESTFA